MATRAFALWAGVAALSVASWTAAAARAVTPEPPCAEPAYALLENANVGQPFSYSEAFGCLPSGHSFSNPEIVWGDGTTSAGSLTAAGGEPFATVRVSGQHTYGQTGEFDVAVELTDDQTGQVDRRSGHTFVMVRAAAPAPSPVPLEPAPPGQPPKVPGARVHLSGRHLVAQRGIARLRVIARLRTSLPPASLHVELDWGDGTSGRGRLGGSSGEFSVSARHGWRRAGKYAVAVHVTSSGGTRLATATSHVVVHAAQRAVR